MRVACCVSEKHGIRNTEHGTRNMPVSRKEQITTVLSMVAITAAFTAVVATVEALARDGIKANEELREVKGAFDALGVDYLGAKTTAVMDRLRSQRLEPETRGDLSFYRGYDREGRPRGYVFRIGGAGFWGPIAGYVAVDEGLERIVGITFVRHSETPGLGARITEESFREQFVGKSIVPPEGSATPIRLVQEGKPKGPNDVDAITGATGTSAGVERFLADNFARIRREMDTSN